MHCKRVPVKSTAVRMNDIPTQVCDPLSKSAPPSRPPKAIANVLKNQATSAADRLLMVAT